MIEQPKPPTLDAVPADRAPKPVRRVMSDAKVPDELKRTALAAKRPETDGAS